MQTRCCDQRIAGTGSVDRGRKPASGAEVKLPQHNTAEQDGRCNDPRKSSWLAESELAPDYRRAYDAPLVTSECEHNSGSVDQGGFLLRDIGMNLAAVRLHSLDAMLADPLYWFLIGGPAVILAIAALYFYSKA